MQRSLNTLRDVEGVLGSFVIDRDGAVLARDVPGMLDDQALLGAGRRLVRLRVALESLSPRVDQCSMRFGEFLLLAKPAEDAMLCVLLSGATNLMALQMGSTLVARRLLADLRATALPEAAAREAPPAAAPKTVPASTPSSPVASAAPARFFRGRPV
jgi:predicted regulator of Ras-like GTPase activity (Roadblock/LC7/MglB family)